MSPGDLTLSIDVDLLALALLSAISPETYHLLTARRIDQ